MTSISSAQHLFKTHCNGILSTHSVDLPGYPFGSLTPYCLDYQGQPIILISNIAQHTQNISHNHKVSLISHDPQPDNSQASGRVTYIADALKLDDTDIADRYYRFYPESQGYHQSHDFDFYTLRCVKVRYIGGFGDIHWISAEQFLTPSPFSPKDELAMISHMNQDHQEALTHYCQLNQIDYEGDTPLLVGVDGEGFSLSVNGRLYRIAFSKRVYNSIDARQAFIDLARTPLPTY